MPSKEPSKIKMANWNHQSNSWPKIHHRRQLIDKLFQTSSWWFHRGTNRIRNYRTANFKIQIFASEDFPVKSTKESVLTNISRKSLAISSPSKPSNKDSNEKSVKRKRRVRITAVLVMSNMTLNWTRTLILHG